MLARAHPRAVACANVWPKKMMTLCERASCMIMYARVNGRACVRVCLCDIGVCVGGVDACVHA